MVKMEVYPNSVIIRCERDSEYQLFHTFVTKQLGVLDFETVVTKVPGHAPSVKKVPYVKTVYGLIIPKQKLFVLSRYLLINIQQHINLTNPSLLNDISFTDMTNSYIGEDIDVALNPTWTLKPVQLDVINWIDDIVNNTTNRLKTALIDLPTGQGKTVTCVGVIDKYKERSLMVFQPRLVDKWVSDLKVLLDSSKSTKVSEPISSMADFITLMQKAKNNEPLSDIIIVSNVIMRNYITAWTTMDVNEFDAIYPCKPIELAPLLKVNWVMVDEVHENFHFNYLLSLVMNVKMYLGLTATLLDDNPIIKRCMFGMFPFENRYGKVKPIVHASSVAVLYDVDMPHKFLNVTKARGYNHIAFEQIILKSKAYTKGYLTIIKQQIDTYYEKAYKDGDKCLIYVTSNAMADTVYNYVVQTYPKRSVSTYVRNDPYDNVIKPDIRISSPIKCKSAIDIPQLTTIIMTCNIKSDKSNIQMLGRGRVIADRDVYFVYLACTDIKKHMDYHTEKTKLLKDLVKKQKTEYFPYRLGDWYKTSKGRTLI